MAFRAVGISFRGFRVSVATKANNSAPIEENAAGEGGQELAKKSFDATVWHKGAGVPPVLESNLRVVWATACVKDNGQNDEANNRQDLYR